MPIFNLGSGRAPWRLPTYTGSHAIFGTKDKGYIECYSSGNLVFPGSGVVDLWMTSSGLAGRTASSTQTGSSQSGGRGGAGGQTYAQYSVTVKRNQVYPVVIPAACSSVTVTNKPSALGITGKTETTLDNGGSAGVAESTGSTAAGVGGDGSKRPFAANQPFSSYFCAGGGGGGAYLRYNEGSGSASRNVSGAAGGSPGGGKGGEYSTTRPSAAGYAASANSAAGGGGGGRHYGDTPVVAGVGGKGGSGIVIIRWGY